MADETPTDRELEALKILWDRSEMTVRDLADAMNAGVPKSEQLAYTTVLSLLQVMEQKGLVEHRREGKAYVYMPRVERQSTIRRLAGSFSSFSSACERMSGTGETCARITPSARRTSSIVGMVGGIDGAPRKQAD